MANPMYGSNKSDAMSGSNVVAVQQTISEANQVYIRAPFDCIVKEVNFAVNTALTTAKSTLGFITPSGTCTGTFEIAHQAAIGASGSFALTDNNVMNAGDLFEIENDVAPDTGNVTFTVVFEQNL